MSDLTRLCLGTAKLGMPWYGAGSVSRPTRAESIRILKRAYTRCGLRCFDTATSYGGAEQACFSVLTHRIVGDDLPPDIITKVWPELVAEGYGWGTGYGTGYCDDWPLRPKHILLHSPQGRQIAAMRETPFGHAIDGASVYTPAEARAALAAGLRVLQVPYCLLDTRHAEVIAEAKAVGCTVFARQPFLQGILVNGVIQQPRAETWLPEQWAAVERCWSLMAAFDVSRVEACLWFALDSPADYVVFGCGSVAHLEEVVAAAQRERPASWPACKAALRQAVAGDEAVVFNSLWAK